MREAKIADLVEVVADLLKWRDQANRRRRQTPPAKISRTRQKLFLEMLDRMAQICSALGLGDAEWWLNRDIDEINYQEIHRHTDAAYAALIKEVSSSKFLKVEVHRLRFYVDNPDAAIRFATEVEKAFPGSVPEVISECKCFALEEWTASVFHGMRALECVLKALATKFSVPVENQTWYKLIEGIEAKVHAIDSSFGPNWKAEKAFYSEAAGHFLFIKDCWRNYVMHFKGHYDEDKAATILQHTRELLIHLSLGPGAH